ncbi:MAG TPA: cytochrome oxidase small assembly protein [Casimicrobiaceae bacterium]|jgi:hypothetical protein|nr:cytochrome oxidase small assembly protein [Casimicrobiaceae bacterium]
MAEPLGTKPVEGAERRRRANVRLAFILASIAATFFAGVIVARYVGGMEFGMSFVGVVALVLLVFAIARNLRDK